MVSMRIFLIAPVLIAMSCNAETQPVPCDADLWSDLIGQAADAADVVPDPKRVIPPNTAVTRDYRFDRTNIDLDEGGIISRIWCG